MKTAVIYARYSSDRQTEQSIEGQVRVCNDFAERNGIVIVHSYIDRATTGTNDNREQFQQMMKDSDKRAWDIVLVYKLDRFSRNKYEMAMHRKRLKDNGIKILSAMENIPETPEGILLESLLEGMNQYYSEELSQKTRRGQRETRLKGLHCAGKLNYGYYTEKKKVMINEEEAAVVREIFTRFAAGERGIDIERDFAERGILYRGKHFTAANMYVILHVEKYTGKYVLHGEEYYDIYPQIITPELYEIARKRIDANRYGKHVPDVTYLLRGKAFCGQCGARLTSYTGTSKTGRVFRYYKCYNAIGKRDCQTKMYQKDVLDQIIIDTLFNLINGENLAFLVDEICKAHNRNLEAENPVKMLEKQLVQVNKSLSNIMVAIENGIITDTTKERLQELETTKRELQERLIMERMREEVRIERGQVEKYLKNGAKETPQMMLDLLVEKVFVHNDKIELVLKYTSTPKPTPPDGEDENNPDGNKHRRGFTIMQTTTQYEVYTTIGLKKGFEPRLKDTYEITVIIEI